MNLELLLEAERRGILPADKAELLSEARNRGLVPKLEAAPEAATKGMGQIIKENILGDDDPTTQNFGEKVGTFLNKAGESMTAGLVGDEASAALESLGGADYEARRDHYREQEALLDRSNPGTALSADIGGALMVPGGGLAMGGARILPKIAKSAGLGSAYGALSGFTEAEGNLSLRAKDAVAPALVGGAMGAFAPSISGAVNKALHARVAGRAARAIAKTAPSSQGLRIDGQRAYKAVDDLGVQIKPTSFAKAQDDITDYLRANTGFDELPGAGSLTPKTARVMQIMGKAGEEMSTDPTAALPFKALDQMRRQAGAAAGNVTEKADQQAGMAVIEGLDDFVRKLGPDDVVAGDVKKLPGLIEKARETWTKMSKSQLIDDAMEAGDSYRAGSSSGIKNQFNKILKSPKLSRGFSEAEKAAMRRVADGTIPEKILEAAGSGLAQVGGLVGAGLGVGTGGIGGALAGIGVAGGSMAARAGTNAITKRNAEIARALIASGRADELPKLAQTLIGTGAEKGLRFGGGSLAAR